MTFVRRLDDGVVERPAVAPVVVLHVAGHDTVHDQLVSMGIHVVSDRHHRQRRDRLQATGTSVDITPVTTAVSRRLAAICAAGAILIALVAVRAHAGHGGVTAELTGDLGGTAAATGAPPTTKTAHPHRLLPPVAGPAGAGGYTFEAAARWDPCQPIRYVVSGSEPFAGANALLAQTLAEAGAASGLQFVAAGTTDEPASPDRPAYQPDRYGRQWAPVLVAWTDQAAVPRLSGNVIGLGGAVSARVHGSTRLVTGLLYFDAPELFLIAQRGTGYSAMRTVMLHEIGHLLGLGHVQDPGAVMYPSDGAQGDYAAGDLRGLAYAGDSPCSHYS